jgi:hypothetical protein
MRSTKLMLALLGFAVTLCAANPFVGTWKMNPAKTTFKEGTAPKEQTVTVTEDGGTLTVKMVGTLADGKPTSISYSAPSAGGEGKILESSPYDSVTYKLEGTNEQEVIYKKGGKTVFTTHSKLSKDGKTRTTSAKGINSAGRKVESEMVYDKQM